jgi:PAS domain S-box-containing protein
VNGKRKKHKISLRTKILITLVSISLVSIVITGGFIINLARDVLIWNIRQRNEQIARQASSEISRYMNNSLNNLKIISETIIPVFFDRWLLNMIIENISLNLREFNTILVVDTSGGIYASSSLVHESTYRPDELFKESLKKGSVVISPVALSKDNLPYITIILPLSISGNRDYLLVAQLNLRSIWDLVDNITIGQKGDAYLISRNGTLIAHPDKTKVLNKIDVNEIPPLPETIPYEGLSVFQRFSATREILMVYMPVQSIDWYVSLRQPLEEAFLPVNSLVSWTFLIIVIVSIIIIFAGLFLTYRFSRPLARLMEVTGIIAKGNFDYNIPITSSDEIGRLSASFNTMVGELKRRSEALVESERKMRLITENVHDIIFSLDVNGNILFLNRQAEIASGFKRMDMLEKPFPSFLAARSMKKIKAYLEKCVSLEKAGMEEIELVLKTKEGNKIILETKIVDVCDEVGEIYFYGVSRDITARKKTERKLHTYQNKLRSLSSQLTLAEEKERRKIASDLHDNISQSLSISLIKLGLLGEVTHSQEARGIIDEISALIESTLRVSKSLTFDLSSPLLYQLGLEAAVEKLSEQMGRQHGLSIHFVANSRTKTSNTDIAILLFRAIKELLINIVKHAHARHVKVFIIKKTDFLEIVVQDDGIGIDNSRLDTLPGQRGGYGLFSIKEKIRHLGGHMGIESKKKKGTAVRIRIPMIQYDM